MIKIHKYRALKSMNDNSHSDSSFYVPPFLGRISPKPRKALKVVNISLVALSKGIPFSSLFNFILKTSCTVNFEMLFLSERIMEKYFLFTSLFPSLFHLFGEECQDLYPILPIKVAATLTQANNYQSFFRIDVKILS